MTETYPSPSPRTGCDSWSIVKGETAGLNSDFSFSLAGCLTKAKEPNLLYYLPIAGEENQLIQTYLEDISAKWNANSLVWDFN